MKFPLPTIAVLFVFSANLCSGQGSPDIEQLYARSRAEYKKAWDLERSGKAGKALPLYEKAARLGDDYWPAAERAGLSDEPGRPTFITLLQWLT